MSLSSARFSVDSVFSQDPRQSFIRPFPQPTPHVLPFVPYSRVNYFDEIFLSLPFISTWLLNLFSCCLYIIILLLWFVKFHLYYILGPRDHPDIVDSFMQLQAQVCFWFLISFTLGFLSCKSLLQPVFLFLLSISLSFFIWILSRSLSLSLPLTVLLLPGPTETRHMGKVLEWNVEGIIWTGVSGFTSNAWENTSHLLVKEHIRELYPYELSFLLQQQIDMPHTIK